MTCSHTSVSPGPDLSSKNPTDSRLARWAEELGVSADSLERLECQIGDAGDLQFPMRNSDGEVIGMRRRFPDGRKLSIEGSRNGLFIVDGLRSDGRLFIAEGPTDTAALLSMDLDAIGLPNAGGCVDMAVAFRQRIGVPEVVIVADADDAGRRGARKLAEALKDICRVRIVEPPEPHNDLRNWLINEPLLREQNLIEHCIDLEPERTTTEISEVITGDAWPDIIDVGTDPLPRFPVDALPPVLGDYAEAVSTSLQVPIDTPGLLGLAVGAFAISKRVELRPEPDWWEPCNIFLCLLQPPAERKSAVLRLMRKPMDDHERALNESLAEQVEKTHRQEKALRARLDRAVKSVANSDDPADRQHAEAEGDRIAAELRALEVVNPVRYVADNATPEAIARLMLNNSGRLLLMSAEAATMDIILGRYAQKGTHNIDVYQHGHAGDRIVIDRIGREPDVIDKPALSIALCVQPSVLNDLATDRALRGRGMLARFLWAMPTSLVGSRTIHPQPIPDDAARAYGDAVRRLLSAEPQPDGTPWTLNLDAEATYGLRMFRADLEGRLIDDLAPVQDWAGKLAGLVCRIAAVLHAYEHQHDFAHRPIMADTITRAIQIGEYATKHALAVLTEMGMDPDRVLARRVATWLRERGEPTVTRRDVYQRLHSSIDGSEDLDGVLKVLEDRWYLRAIPPTPGKPGRPSEVYAVNPQAYGTGCKSCRTLDGRGF